MAIEMQETGINAVGDMVSWGDHLRISSTHWSHTTSQVWNAGSTACGLLLSP